MVAADQMDSANSQPRQNVSTCWNSEPDNPGDKHCADADNEPNSNATRVQTIIEKAGYNRSVILDLSRQNLTEIPEAVLSMHHLEFVYFEGNRISRLPENLFDQLPNLKWLDLRYNQLMYLPSVFLSQHGNLKTLLLQGNRLRTLPLELGMVSTLKGLSLSENPLEFPPASIIARGTDEVLRYLRESMLIKTQSEVPELDRITQLNIRDNGESGASTEDELPQRPMTSPTRQEELEELGIQQASLHRPVSYYQIKQQHMDKVDRARGSGKVRMVVNKDGRKLSIKSETSLKPRHPTITPYPEPPPAALIEERAAAESRRRRIRQIKEKQESILQRRRNEEALKDFRHDSKRLQSKRYRETMKRGEDYNDTAHVAPYGYESTYDKVRNKEDLIKHQVRLAHENMSRPMSPGTKERVEHERSLRDRELEKKVKQHTTGMLERRKQSRGSAAEEMEAARREMEVGLRLERELKQRQRELEYRFQAFTG